jgi:undecaprenyl diphosphate synthase
MKLVEKIDKDRLPEHIAIIMDGNGRWAKKHNESRIYGHKNGVKSVRDTVEACAELGVPYLTLYAFSTENWSRPKAEVNALMELLVDAIRDETQKLQENDIRLHTIGDIRNLPQKCHKELAQAQQITADNQRLNLILALNYSARWDITQAVRQIGQKLQDGEFSPQEINESLISEHLSTKDFPDPELLIRTSGEMRISNFLLWQIAYTELYFTPTLWPDFRVDQLYKAILDFQQRERRFGKISEQVSDE